MLGGRSGVHCFWNIPLVPQVRLDYDGREPLYQLAAVQRGTPGFISFKANFTLFRLSRLSCASFFHTFQKGAAAGKLAEANLSPLTRVFPACFPV